MKDIVILMIGNNYTLRVGDEQAEAIFNTVERACTERKAMWLDLNDGHRRAKLAIGHITGFYIKNHTETSTDKLIKVQTEMSEEVLKKLKEDDGDSWKDKG